jgi:uncharacterized OB-fold protein
MRTRKRLVLREYNRLIKREFYLVRKEFMNHICEDYLERTDFETNGRDVSLYISRCTKCGKFYVFWIDMWCEVWFSTEDNHWYFCE